MKANHTNTIEISECYLNSNHLEDIQHILEDLSCFGIRASLVVDTAGNVVAEYDNGTGTYAYDFYSLASLASANFSTVAAMARIIGEREFSFLFHKGKNESIHFSKINDEFLLIIIFGNDVSLGLLRLKIANTLSRIREIWGAG